MTHVDRSVVLCSCTRHNLTRTLYLPPVPARPIHSYKSVVEGSQGLLIDVCSHLTKPNSNYVIVGGWVPYLRAAHSTLVRGYGVRGTPAWLLNGTLIDGAIPVHGGLAH